MNAYRRDAVIEGAARAHADAVPVPKKEANRMHVTPRTARRWCHTGPPQVRQMSMYLDGHPNPHRVIAYLRTQAEADIRDMTKAALLAEYRRLLLEECQVEADDRRGCFDGSSWLDVAAQSERDAAVDLRKAAIEREFAVRRISREEVRHG